MLRPRVGGEGKGSVDGLPIVDNESSNFLCTEKTSQQAVVARIREAFGCSNREAGRKRSGSWRPAGWERDRNIPSILIRRLWVQRGGSRQKTEDVKAGVRAKCESQIVEARGKTEAKG